MLLGHSAGGHLALWLAERWRPLSGVVALAPVVDLALASKAFLHVAAAVGSLR